MPEWQKKLIYKYRYRVTSHWDKLFFSFSFFMVFPVILIFDQNFSFFFFLGLISIILRKSRFHAIGLSHWTQKLALLFGIGAILSVVNIAVSSDVAALKRSITVLPNYLYWTLLIVFLVQQRSIIRLEVLYRAIFWGIIFYTFYYLFFQKYATSSFIFNRVSPNSFSFVLICFAPLAVYHLKILKGNLLGVIFLSFLVSVLVIEGRRAGMVLVFFGGVATLYGDKINALRLLRFFFSASLLLLFIYTSEVENFVLNTNQRIHGLIYETRQITSEDRSYLVRVAQVNKGLALFRANPLTGVGLNNFSNIETEFNTDFEGAEFVVDKNGLQEKSAHNSYIQVLAEGGVLLFLPWVILLLGLLYFFIKNYNNLSSKVRPLYFGLIAMCVHLYFISSIVNVYAWFLIGLCSAFSLIRLK